MTGGYSGKLVGGHPIILIFVWPYYVGIGPILGGGGFIDILVNLSNCGIGYG